MMCIRGGSITDELGVYRRGASKGVRKRLSLQLKDWFCCIEEEGNFTSRTRIAAPSLMTKPLRSLSNDRDASCGVSLKDVAKERDRSKPVNARGWMQDSAPPASITSASPNAMNRDASPMECAPVVQAVVTA